MTERFSPLSWIDAELAELEARELRRRRRLVEQRNDGRISIAGRSYVDFSSNDYLGLSGHPEIIEAGKRGIDQWGWGAGASSLITGYTKAHADLEQRIATFEGTESAIVFASGFAANLGTLAALAEPGDLILSERRNHASLIDGCRLSRATVRLFDGDRLDELETLFHDGTRFRRRLIVTDSVFSMDGDVAPLKDLADLAERFDAILYVDEAHATGVLGERGRGACEMLGIEERVPVRMGTLSKAVGSVGGFVAGSAELIDWLCNRVRPYIYTTNLPAAAATASAQGLELVQREPGRRAQLLEIANGIRKELEGLGFETGRSTTQIIPIIMGQPSRAIELSARMAEAGLWCPAIRPPTVPSGTSRLRLSLSFNHKGNQIIDLIRFLSLEAKGLKENESRMKGSSPAGPI
jgi:8-amino-7-oxononanoate synthase